MIHIFKHCWTGCDFAIVGDFCINVPDIVQQFSFPAVYFLVLVAG